ncbi:MAG: 30S ribosomal protein S12 methylthiotransferase RimO [Proteobacteria bacterium]|nr:30S ribosomal protein S12 methylthiotransferase RimO [Pseudomonadota bacterium]
MSDQDLRVHLISLGCPKNRVDSEYMLGCLAELGYRVVDDPAEAGLIVINTCAFIQSAVQESVETILAMGEFKRDQGARLVVTGCLPQRYQNELAASLPEVDVFLGTGRLDRLADYLDKPPDGRIQCQDPGFAPDRPGPRLRSAPFFQAYLKIAEGCSNACTYCLIPRLRGPLRSRPRTVLLEEASALAESGVVELVLVAQDTTAYGRDLAPKETLARLLADLAEIPGLQWLRVMYAYPSGLSRELLEVMAGQEKVAPYLDLPLQHASPAVLKRMGRSGRIDPIGLVERLRRAVPGLTLRTTMMVGFPGETEEDFARLLDFVQAARFEHLGVFKFSPEEGTAAARSKTQVPQRIKEVRRRKLMALQRRISRGAQQQLVGRILPVLIEGLSEETDLLLAGRTAGQAPDIDGLVYITKGTAAPGRIEPVRITQAHDYDLVGEIVET